MTNASNVELSSSTLLTFSSIRVTSCCSPESLVAKKLPTSPAPIMIIFFKLASTLRIVPLFITW